jgi:hypothetical protein
MPQRRKKPKKKRRSERKREVKVVILQLEIRGLTLEGRRVVILAEGKKKLFDG